MENNSSATSEAVQVFLTAEVHAKSMAGAQLVYFFAQLDLTLDEKYTRRLYRKRMTRRHEHAQSCAKLNARLI